MRHAGNIPLEPRRTPCHHRRPCARTSDSSPPLALAAGSARAAPTRLAVVTLDAPPQLQFTGKSVAEAFAQNAAKAGLEVVGPAAVEEKLGRAAHAELVRCADDAKCLAEKGARLGVDRIVGGWLQQRGTSYRVAIVHADVKTGDRLGGLEREIPVASRRLQKDVAAAAPGLLASGDDATGVLRITTDVPGAEVILDDVAVGRTPIARVVAPGKHKVQLNHEGWAEQDATWVEVPANGLVEHRPRRYLIPARDRPNASPTEGQGTAVERVKAPAAARK